MGDIVAAIVLLVIIGAAAGYVIKAKKSGRKCIGCPEGCCSKKGTACSCCSGQGKTE